MDIEFALIFSAAAVIFSIGMLVFAQGFRYEVNRAFTGFTVFLALWLITNYFSLNNVTDLEKTELFIELVLVVTVPMCFSLIAFAFMYPSKTIKELSQQTQIAITGMAVYGSLLIIIGLSGNFVNGVSVNGNNISPAFSMLFPLYAIYAILTVVIASYALWSTYKSGDKKTREDIRPIFNSAIVTVTGIALTNLIFVILFKNSASVGIGPIFTIFFIYYTAKAILERQLLGTRVLIGRIIYFVIVAALPYFLYFFIAYIYEVTLGEIFHPIAYLIGIGVSIAFVIVFNRFNNFIKQQVSTRFINPGYDPFEVIDTLGKDLATSLELTKVTEYTLAITKRTIRASFEALVIIDSETKRPPIMFADDKVKEQIQGLNYATILNLWKTTSQVPIIFAELEYLSATPFRDFKNWIKPIENQMEDLGIKVIFPIGNEKNILGMLILGAKEANTLFTTLDIDLLKSISSTVGIAISRALFYEEIKQFSESLQHKVDEATINLKKQNEALEIALIKLQKLRQQEQDMIDILGHELRTPITVVRNALSVLVSDFKPDSSIEPERLNSYISRALRATKREMVLIETLLAATKIDANRIQLKLEKIDLIEALNDTLYAHESVAKERALELKTELPANTDHLFIYADKVRTQEVLDNFVSNALKYTMKGQVSISFSETKLPNTNEAAIKVSVHDTGIGIPEEDVAKLGRKFFRARQYISETDGGIDIKVSGTGLGLYVSFELIKIMGGDVKVESKLGEGSTFSFILPKYTGQPVKNIDQTFSGGDEIEERLRETISQKSPEKTLEAAVKASEGIEDEPLRSKFTTDTPGVTPIETELSANQYKPGMRKLTSANDIMKKINEGRKFLEDDASDQEVPIIDQPAT